MTDQPIPEGLPDVVTALVKTDEQLRQELEQLLRIIDAAGTERHVTSDERDLVRSTLRSIQQRYRKAATSNDYQLIAEEAEQRIKQMAFFIDVLQSYQMVAQMARKKMSEERRPQT